MTDTMTSPTPSEQEPSVPDEQTPATPEQGPPSGPTDNLPPMLQQPVRTEPGKDMLGVPAGEDVPTVPIEKPKGAAGEIRKIADDYVIPISDYAADEWAKVSKDGTHAEFTEYAKQVAAGLYPTLAPQIEMGLTTRVLVDPYIELAEKTLGPMPKEPDWSDPKWAAALQGGIDPKTGRSVPMTMGQWQMHLMTDPGHNFDQSPAAMNRVMDFINHMHKEFTGQPLQQQGEM